MNKTSTLSIKHLNVSYGKFRALSDLSLNLPMGSITGIVGPNGAGKSTLLKTLCQIQKAQSGQISIDEKPLSFYKSEMAYVPQKREMNLDFPILVEEVVAQGALGKKAWYQGLRRKDFENAHMLLKKLDLYDLAKKSIGELSGGQQQRVFLARALMQEAKILFLDEPFVGLDIVSEEKLMSELRSLAEQGMSIFIVHHDLHSWKNYFDQLVILKNTLVAAGPIQEVFTPENLQSAYGINFKDF